MTLPGLILSAFRSASTSAVTNPSQSFEWWVIFMARSMDRWGLTSEA